MAENVVNKGGVLVTPPLSTQQHLDWIEITTPILGKKPTVPYPAHWSKKFVECKPMNGYSVACRYDDGRIEMQNASNPNMGIHTVMSATTLQNLQEDDKWLLGYFLAEGVRVTRLDCALDIYHNPLNFDELWELARRREFVCNLRKPPLREQDAKTGDTVYFGRLKASVVTRVYNKAAEQNVKGDWVRVETMFRHSRANNAAKLMVRKNLDCRALIAGHVRIPKLKWWSDIMTNEPEKTRLDPAGVSKRVHWLLNSVSPTIAKEIHLRGWGIWDEIRLRVVDELQKIDS